jgi:non-canonical (house-cleaning) NTP pyrophosphatase
MRVHVGSKNRTKVDAVAGIFSKSAKFSDAEIFDFPVDLTAFARDRYRSQAVIQRSGHFQTTAIGVERRNDIDIQVQKHVRA